MATDLLARRVPSTCRSCHARIFWARTAPGRKLTPVDWAPRSDGTLELGVIPDTVDGTAGTALAVIVVTQPSLTDEPRFVTHFATCPDASAWRQQRDANQKAPR